MRLPVNANVIDIQPERAFNNVMVFGMHEMTLFFAIAKSFKTCGKCNIIFGWGVGKELRNKTAMLLRFAFSLCGNV